MHPAFVKELLPGDLPDASVESLRVLRIEGPDKIEDPVTRPDMEVQSHRIGERPLRFDGSLPFHVDGKAERADLFGKPGDDPFRAGDENFPFLDPRVHEHSFCLTQAWGNAKENRPSVLGSSGLSVRV
jgi:hypothetical protein